MQFFSDQQFHSSAALHERCSYFLSRKKRLCSHRVAAPGLKFCTLHEPSTLLQLQRDSECRHTLNEIVSAVVASLQPPVATLPAARSSAASSMLESLAPAPPPDSEVAAASVTAQNGEAVPPSLTLFGGKRKRRRKSRTSAPKRMVNPFSTFYSQSILLPKNWGVVFSDPALPLTIDVGCARGTLLDKLAAKHPEQNFLGIEIRPKLVEEAVGRSQHLPNLHFIAGKFSADQAVRLIDSLPLNVIYAVCFQFPDPWRKKKQLRRRVLQPELASVLAEKLPRGCHIYISSDVKDVCEGMRKILQLFPAFVWMGRPGFQPNKNDCPSAVIGAGVPVKVPVGASDDGETWWLKKSFLGEPSERGLVCEQDWRVVWRGVFTVN